MFPSDYKTVSAALNSGVPLALTGNTPLAIQNYEKSLSLDPTNTNAAMMLKKLKGQ